MEKQTVRAIPSESTFRCVPKLEMQYRQSFMRVHMQFSAAKMKPKSINMYGIEYQYMVALHKLDVEFFRKVMEHTGRRSKASDPLGLHRIPIIEIVYGWVRGWRTC